MAQAKKPATKTRSKKFLENKQLYDEVKEMEPTKVTEPAIEGEVKMGRPSKYSQDLVDEICAQLAMGYSLRTVCKPDTMPDVKTIFNWIHTKPEFLQQYTQAKEEAADAMADEILDISDNGTNDWMEVNFGGTRSWVTNGEALQRSRLRVETRKWLMAKMKPKKYGDRLVLDPATDELPAPILGAASKAIDVSTD